MYSYILAISSNASKINSNTCDINSNPSFCRAAASLKHKIIGFLLSLFTKKVNAKLVYLYVNSSCDTVRTGQ